MRASLVPRFALVIAGVAAMSALAVAAPRPPAKAAAFDSDRAYGDLRQIVTFGPRPAGSAALAETRTYIEGELKKAGVTFHEQPFDASTPLGKVHMVNIVATFPGTSPDRLLITGHYDTKLFRQFRFVGADDGGSSAAFLLELARVLQHRRNRMTIEIVFFDGEEAMVDWTGTDHTYGSRYFVEHARRTGTLGSIKAMVLVDMIGDRQLDILRDDNSTAWLTDIVWSTAKRLGFDSYFLDRHTGIEDDHFPFLQAGVPSVDIIDLDYPYWHQAGDTLDKVSARSLQIVGDVVLGALPAIEARAMAEQ
ncbi:MAG TPA: M28 family peptidase [Vicinamibacterales bacterium]|nr:M28 family peptidase [Vicinamibacterales bacterium]